MLDYNLACGLSVHTPFDDHDPGFRVNSNPNLVSHFVPCLMTIILVSGSHVSQNYKQQIGFETLVHCSLDVVWLHTLREN